ncbi:MAG: FHA domain-containing protein [Steroidobacteraceae bacterium]|nr:FHA domain-containing protein [Steroidobacteraceae bacterium]
MRSEELLGLRPAGSGRDAQAPASTAPAADAAASRIAKLEQQCFRLAHELSSVACDADRRDREYQAQIDALVRRLHECESELSDRDGRLASMTQAYEGLRSQVENGGVPATAAAAVYRRELRRNAEVATGLRARLEERGRALELAGEQIAALHAERARLIDALDERTRQVGELVAQLTRGEVRDGFGIDFRSGLGPLLLQDASTTAESGVTAGWHTPGINEQTIVLEAGPPPDTAAESATPGPVTVAGPAAAVPGPRLRRYLLPVQSDVDPPFELTGPRSYVGRGIEADVCLAHPTVSRLHGVLYRIGGSTIVEDARSSNGVFVNRERVQQAVLKDGDIVSFGNVAFWFRVTVSDS